MWQAYRFAKAFIPNVASKLPDRAWDILYASQKTRSSVAPGKRRDIQRVPLDVLCQDMRSVGKPFTVQQEVARLWRDFLHGKQELALKKWEEDRTQFGREGRQDYKAEHLGCGVQMHAHAGHVERARDIMKELENLYPKWKWNHSLRMLVFRACTNSPSNTHHDIAWDLYDQMRATVDKPTLEFYDACFVGFLEARNFQNSKKVFGDMVKLGLIAQDPSKEHINGVLRRFHLLYRLGTDIVKATNIALQAISILPKPYHPHVFGEWLRTANIEKAPAAALQVLELMFQRGHEPKTIHYNLVLRALFHTSEKPHILKAENMAWQMIDTLRKEGLPTTQYPHAAAAISNAFSVDPNTPQSDPLPRKTPRANSVTFALLMRHHANHSQWEHVDYLKRQMNQFSMRSNEDVMNVLMEMHRSQGNLEEVWRTYSSLTNVPDGTPGVFPNGATFRCLWKTLRDVLRQDSSRSKSEFPSPRSLLAENVRWWALVRSRYDARRFRLASAAEEHGALTKLIINCFSSTYDISGSLVALHVLRKHFNILPSGRVAIVLRSQLAYMEIRREDHAGPKAFANKAEQMAQIYSMLMDARLKRMHVTAGQFADMTEEEQGDITLDSLSEFIRVIMKRLCPPEKIESLIDEAKGEIGLPDMSTGDMDAFSTM